MAKGAKLLNPADKARKEARKKELKKNKKQRQQARLAAQERQAKLKLNETSIKKSEAIREAQELKIEDVFLPPEGEKPPGCPPGFPPDLRQLVHSLNTMVQQPLPYRNRVRPDNNITPISSNRAIEPKNLQTVIESKPILFKRKMTKFVPSSVRSKVTGGTK